MPRAARPSLLRRFLGLVGRLVALIAILWLGGLAWFMITLPAPVPLSVRTDGVAVLTGGPGRIARGIEVLEGASARRMLVSGVDPAVTRAEFRAAARLPQPLLDCCVELGFEARSTRGNAAEIARWADRHRLRSIRVVTAHYHMRRARAELAAALPPGIRIETDAVAAPLGARGLVEEYHKTVASRLLLATGRNRAN